MAYCTSCGEPLKDGVKFCPSCGAEVGGKANEVLPEEPVVSKEQTVSGKRPEKSPTREKKIIDSGPRPRQNYVPSKIKKPKKKGGCLRFFLKSVLVLFILMIVGVVIIYFLPDNHEVDRLVNELPEIKKGEDINIEVSTKKIVTGDLINNNILLDIPPKTFDKKKVKLVVKEVNDAPEPDAARAKNIGNVYDISIDQKSKRLNKPVKVRLNLFKPEGVKIENPYDIRVGYFNGKRWDYFKPDTVDLKGKYLGFKTFHFSLFIVAKPTKEEMINEFAKEEAVSRWAKKTNNAPTKYATEKMIKQVLLERFGIRNKGMVQDVVESIMNEDDYRKLLVSYNDNNMEQFGQDLAILAGKKIIEVAKDHKSLAKDVLGGVTDHASKINAGINITRALADGDYEKAAKELSMEIINTYPVTKLFREAARVTQNQIDRWKNQELEAAYQVFSKGAESKIPFWGYSVDPGDFEAVWDQMKGLQAQILRDGIKEYGIKHHIDVNKLGHSSLNHIRWQIKEDLRKEFIKRKKEEADIEKIKQENIKLIAEFESADLLTRYRFGFTEQTSYDQMLRRLFLVKNMILKDTRSKLGFSGINSNGIISSKRIARLIQLWYSRDGKAKYKEELVKLGYIKEKGDLELADGPWEIEFADGKELYNGIDSAVKIGDANWAKDKKRAAEIDSKAKSAYKKALKKCMEAYKEAINIGFVNAPAGKYEDIEKVLYLYKFNPVQKRGLYVFTVTEEFDLEKGEKILFVIDLKNDHYFEGKAFYIAKGLISIDYIKGKLKN